jgi:hypothetical protein
MLFCQVFPNFPLAVLGVFKGLRGRKALLRDSKFFGHGPASTRQKVAAMQDFELRARVRLWDGEAK